MRERMYRKVLCLSDEVLRRITTTEEVLRASQLLLSNYGGREWDDEEACSIQFESRWDAGRQHLTCLDRKKQISIAACVLEPGALGLPGDEDLLISSLTTGKLQLIMPFRVLREMSVDIGHAVLAAKMLCGRRIRQIGFLGADCRLLEHVDVFEKTFELECIGVLCRSQGQREIYQERLSDRVESPVYFFDTPKALVESSDLVICPDNGHFPVVMPEWLKQGALVIDYTGGRNLPADLLCGTGQLILGNKEMDLPQLQNDKRLQKLISETDVFCDLSEVLDGPTQTEKRYSYRIYAHADQNLTAVALAQVLYQMREGRKEKSLVTACAQQQR